MTCCLRPTAAGAHRLFVDQSAVLLRTPSLAFGVTGTAIVGVRRGGTIRISHCILRNARPTRGLSRGAPLLEDQITNVFTRGMGHQVIKWGMRR